MITTGITCITGFTLFLAGGRTLTDVCEAAFTTVNTMIRRYKIVLGLRVRCSFTSFETVVGFLHKYFAISLKGRLFYSDFSVKTLLSRVRCF